MWSKTPGNTLLNVQMKWCEMYRAKKQFIANISLISVALEMGLERAKLGGKGTHNARTCLKWAFEVGICASELDHPNWGLYHPDWGLYHPDWVFTTQT